jgi:hypothetical protein
VLWAKECAPILSFVVFTLRLAFESFKKLGGALETFFLVQKIYDFNTWVE